MKQSEQINELVTAITKVQASLEPVFKDAKNYQKHSYSTIDSVLKVALKKLSENGIALFQGLGFQDGKSVLITQLAHTSGQWIASYAPLLPVKQDSQGMGGAITYMRRYALASLLGISGTDEKSDDDGSADRMALEKKEAEQKHKKIPINHSQLAELENILSGDVAYRQSVMTGLQSMEITKLSDVPVEIFESIKMKSAARKQKQQLQRVPELAF